jgi:hypothetical protein
MFQRPVLILKSVILPLCRDTKGEGDAAVYGTVTGPNELRPRRSTPFALVNVEPMTGIEPAYSAWEADVLPLNYIGLFDHEG